jgi:hypothetical protein
MLKMVSCLCVVAYINASTEEIEFDYVKRLQEIEQESYKAVDEIFMHIRTAVINKEKRPRRAWFNYLKNNELQYLLTEARIYSFDTMTDNIMIEKINNYLDKKIRGDMQLVLMQGADIKGVKEFLFISQMMCELSDGVNCKELMQAIKNENRQAIDELKKQREAQQKEECLARENILAQSKG